MNILNKYTRKTLWLNKTRTWVTIIGIALSTALFTAIIQGAYSGQQYLYRCEKSSVGGFEAVFKDLEEDRTQTLLQDNEIKDHSSVHEVGWAEIQTSNTYKPYLHIMSVDDNIEDMVSIHMQKGRLPENSGELLICRHVNADGDAGINVGDTLTLDIGMRVVTEEGADIFEAPAGERLGAGTEYMEEGAEEIKSTISRTYTVVGICERPDRMIESYKCPGYTAFTTGEETVSGYCDFYFAVKHPGKIFNWLKMLSTSAAYEQVAENGIDYSFLKGTDYDTHTELLAFSGVFGQGNLSSTIYGLAAILIALLLFGSISLIYNSFSISVNERTKQFGILKSIGATKKQIKNSIYYEGLVLSAIAIPAGIIIGLLGIGITLYALRNSFAGILNLGNAENVQMQLVVSPLGLVIAAVICLLTVLISARVPARRAMRISAIEAIRQTADIKIKSKEVKTSRLTTKLFGFEGMMAAKNAKRNKKGYRATIIGLFVSTVLFVTASSFCAYLKDMVGGITNAANNVDVAYTQFDYDQIDPEELFKRLMEAGGVTQGTYMSNCGAAFYIDEAIIDSTFLEHSKEMYSGDVYGRTSVYADEIYLQDSFFDEICRENGLDPEAYHNEDTHPGLVFNQQTQTMLDGEGNRHYYTDNVLKGNYPCTICKTEIVSPEGYICCQSSTDENGLTTYYFISEEYWEAHDYANEAIVESELIALTQEEAEQRIEYTIGAQIKEPPFFCPTSNMFILYPFSTMPEDPEQVEYCFVSSDHAETFEQMKKIIDEMNLDTSWLNDMAEEYDTYNMVINIVNVFSYGFIILISLIAIANVFNTISTSISLRRREFAMLKSIGMSQRGFMKMMNHECVRYGVWSLAIGLPVACGLTWIIHRVVSETVEKSFYIPWYSIVIAIGTIFVVVFATMLYATRKIKQANPIENLKSEII